VRKKVLYTVLVLVLTLGPLIYGDDQLISEDLPPVLDYITREDGLSNLSVSSIVEDKYGIMWFGTQGGLNRYDGQSMTVYRSNPFDTKGLLHNLIQTMAYDPVNHVLWIGTYQGLSSYNIHQDTFTNYTVADNKLSNEVVVTILLEGDYIWVGTLDGLNRIDPETKEIITYPVPGKVVRDLHLGSDQILYLGTYEGLCYFDSLKKEVTPIDLDLPSPYVMTLDEFDLGYLTLGMWEGGLAHMNLADKSLTYKTFEDNRVYSVLQTKDTTRWVGTWGGGLFVEDQNGSTYHYEGSGQDNDLPHKVVYSMYQSQSDILWIGTNGGGIVKINPRKRNYVSLHSSPDRPQGLSPGKINLLHRDHLGDLWIAVYNTGIERYTPETGQIKKYFDPSNQTMGNNVTSVFQLDQDNLLLGTEIGFFNYNYQEDAFSPLDLGLGEKIIYALEVHDQTLWIGTYNEGLYAYDFTRSSIVNFSSKDQTLSDNLVYDIHHDSQGRLWVATNNGLNLRRPDGTFKVYYKVENNTSHLPNNNTRVIFEDKDQNIWIGTGGGLSLFQESTDSFSTFTEEDGLSNNMILAILQHDNGDIWVSTSDGISIINLETQSIKTLSTEDGIGGYEFNTGHLKDQDGTLHFAGVHGITSIPPSFNEPSTSEPNLYITGVHVFQHQVDVPVGFFNNKSLTFKPSDNMLTFDFLALDYDAPDKVTYYYRLTPLARDWISLGTSDFITYSNLKPGSYHLEVYAESSRGVKTQPVSLDFVIEKPWYLTWYAFMAYGCLFIFLIYIIIKLRESRYLKLANLQLEELSIKDGLTGVYNRRYFDDVMEQYLQLAKRSQAPMGIIMIDIDDFKAINDSKGHLAGDQVLKNISSIIQDSLQRSTDFVARYGGDEFVIALYDTPLQGVLDIARYIMEAVSHQSVTLSMGAHSQIPAPSTTVESLVKQADHLLYDSKSKGKNRITHQDQ